MDSGFHADGHLDSSSMEPRFRIAIVSTGLWGTKITVCSLRKGSLFGERVKKSRGEGRERVSNREPVHRLHRTEFRIPQAKLVRGNSGKFPQPTHLPLIIQRPVNCRKFAEPYISTLETYHPQTW